MLSNFLPLPYLFGQDAGNDLGGGYVNTYSPTVIAKRVDGVSLQVSTNAVNSAGSVGTPTSTPVAIGAGTLYGISSSNYGLGPGFQSTQVMASQAAVQQNLPSMWWLVAALVIVAVFTHE